MAWLNEAAPGFARAGEGTIIGISSVSGDRGRRGQPAYCASKAALDTYLEALRNRLRRRGVTVVIAEGLEVGVERGLGGDRKSTRLNSSHQIISYAVFCLKKKKT